MSDPIDTYIHGSVDPASAENRINHLLNDPGCAAVINKLQDEQLRDFINLISFSNFLYRHVYRYPDAIYQIGNPFESGQLVTAKLSTIDDLKKFKYERLLNIIWMDISDRYDYPVILSALSQLAELIINQTLKISIPPDNLKIINDHLCTFALGKLGAGELNFSSDIDLIFVCSNPSEISMEPHDYQHILQDAIRKLSNQLENRTADGFLYRVDLKLRPWGRSGPLVMTIDETENYYEASSEAWERFAWLRARAITGPDELSGDLTNRLHPFVYRRSLSSDDLDRFFEIKSEMSKVRRRKGYWNVKLGEGGIRDLEFFIQMLQLVNAYGCEDLQGTATLSVLSGLNKHGFLTDHEAAEIRHSYLFLRRLENRLQMIDEAQTHELPDEFGKRLIVAKSMNISGESESEIIDQFETELFTNQSIAKNYFERLLPED